MLKRILYLIKTTVNPFGILSFTTGLIAVIVYMVLANLDYDPLNSGYMTLILYLCIILVGSIIIRFIDERKKAENPLKLEESMVGVISKQFHIRITAGGMDELRWTWTGKARLGFRDC